MVLSKKNLLSWLRPLALLVVVLVHQCLPLLAIEELRISQLLPEPKSYVWADGWLRSRSFVVEAEVHAQAAKALLREFGYRVGSARSLARLSIRLAPRIEQAGQHQAEAYRLSIRPRGILIEATTSRGAYWGLQTLGQLLLQAQGGPLEACQIVDWPSWSIRGIMHDVGRTYLPLEELKRQIALLSRFKLNTFHWHLTENQAWRLESKIYPQLNRPEITERMPGKYYTLAEARELAEWCRAHEVLLIPEVDMPGHSAAFERAMGFGMQTAQGKAALKALLREMAEAMEVPYIHIGTDEVEFTDPSFVPEMVAYVRSLGRKAISWNPGWDYQPGQIDMTQLWSYRGQAQPGIPAIDSRLHYINHYDLFADVVALYGSKILRRDEGSAEAAGAILAVWNDRFVPEPRAIMAQNNVYASALALAERAWIGGGYGYFDRKASLLLGWESPLYRNFRDFEQRMLYYKERWLSAEAMPYVQQTDAEWLITEAMPNEGELGRSFPPEEDYFRELRAGQYAPPTELPHYRYRDSLYRTQRFFGSGFYLRHVWGEGIAGGVYERPEARHTAYAMTWVHSPREQTVGLLFETQNYSRSESDLPPPRGEWDYRQSRIWINGVLVPPPLWSAEHRLRSQEIPLGNENATARAPLRVFLRKGWNRVLVKLPLGELHTPETRLVKWMFTASFVTLDGRAAAPELTYRTVKGRP